MIDSALKKLFIEASVNTRSAWAIVRDGVVAEFCLASDDRPVHRFDDNTLTVETSRASLQLTFDDDIKPIAAEIAAYRCSPWVQAIYLCLPEQTARMSGRKVLTHLGSWDNAGGDGELWDLGVGNDSLDACIIVNDIRMHQKLREKEGHSIIDDPEFLEELIKLSPPRLFRTKFAHILVRQRIPSNDNEEVEGPHTHLLPSIIRNGIHFPLPIPDSMRSVVQVDPFGSVIDGNGYYHEWKGFEQDEFQSLLHEYGVHEYVQMKWNLREEIIPLLENNEIRSIVAIYSDKDKQDVIRTILAQLVCDKNLSIDVRERALAMLGELKAVNLHGLKQWIRQISPELLK